MKVEREKDALDRRASVNAMKFLRCVLALMSAVCLCGCPTMHPQHTGGPQRIAVSGVYLHAPSKVTFPETVGHFKRDAVLRYDAEGLDVSVAYNCLNALHPMATTVYVYPAPSVVSFGSPPEVVATARAKLTRTEFENRKQEILRAHPDAKLVAERDTVRSENSQSYPGRIAVFEYTGGFAGSTMPVRSHLYLFCYVGDKWAVKYRFTHPRSIDADKEIENFIRSLNWYASGELAGVLPR